MTTHSFFQALGMRGPTQQGRRGIGLLTGRPIGLAMLTVVVCFGSALYVSQSRGGGIIVRSEDIGRDALPSIEHLVVATAELRRLGMDLHRYVADSSRERPNSKPRVESSWHRLAEEIAAYRALPTFAGEKELSDKLDASVTSLDESLRDTLEQTELRNFEEARQMVRRSFRDRVEEVDRSIHHLITFNIASAREAAGGIGQLQRRAETIALVLGGFSLLAAAIATLLAYRAIQGQSRLAEGRAAELEAFAGRVAHDLKQPLGAMALRIITAQLRPVPESLDRMIEQLKRMDRTIDGLLDFARSGAKPPAGERSNVAEVIQDVIADVKPAAEEARAELRAESCAPIVVACSPAAMTSVLSNLVRNAVKFIVEGSGPARQIIVRVADRGKMARISVEDTGPGLPPGVERRIFEPYVRLPGSSQPGVGLGLATVKRIVEAYGGTAGVQSVEGAGSLFWFELPKAPSASRTLTEARMAS